LREEQYRAGSKTAACSFQVGYCENKLIYYTYKKEMRTIQVVEMEGRMKAYQNIKSMILAFCFAFHINVYLSIDLYVHPRAFAFNSLYYLGSTFLVRVIQSLFAVSTPIPITLILLVSLGA